MVAAPVPEHAEPADVADGSNTVPDADTGSAAGTGSGDSELDTNAVGRDKELALARRIIELLETRRSLVANDPLLASALDLYERHCVGER